MLSIVFKYPMISKVLLSEVRSIQKITQRYFIHNKKVFSAGLTVRTKRTRPSNGLVRQSFLKPKSLPQGLSVRHQQTSKWDINTNVQNNVLLYKYENPKYFRNMKLFVLGQLIGWSVLAYVLYRPKLLDIFTTDITIKQYLVDNIGRLLIFICSTFIGPSMCLILYVLNSRSVKYIILHKGGETLTLVTHHFLKNKSSINNLAITSVNCISHRTDRGVYVPLKVKDRWFYYLVEKKGTFVNPQLFDHIVG